MNVGARVVYTIKQFEEYGEGFETTRNVTPKVDRDDRDTGTILIERAIVGRDATDLKNIITNNAGKIGALEWSVSKPFDTQHPIGIRSIQL